MFRDDSNNKMALIDEVNKQFNKSLDELREIKCQFYNGKTNVSQTKYLLKALSYLIPFKYSEKSGLDVYNRLADDESRYNFTMLFYHWYVWDHKSIVYWLRSEIVNIVMNTLQNRLKEKGNDLTKYEKYDKLFFFGKDYFDLPAFKPCDDEVFIDAGAYIGDSIEGFLAFCNKKYKHIYSFDPSQENFQKLCENVQKMGLQNITLVPKGLHRTTQSFSGSGTKGTYYIRENSVAHFDDTHITAYKIPGVHDSGTTDLQVVSLDTFLPEYEKVTFIKMDIEGAELDALIGAKETIKRCKPKMAICIYHKPKEDLINIPSYILSLVPEYKFYIRQHNPTISSTVLYATVE